MSVTLSEETVLSQKSEQNGNDRHKNFLHNMALPINRLPFEILIAVINLSLPGPPTEFKPYPCLIFSWVCHHWRSLVLGNPIFWNRIAIDYRSSKDMGHPMIKEILRRSHNVPLDIAGYNPNLSYRELGQHVNRVRMLRLGIPRAFIPYPPLSYFTSLFPSLTMLFLEDYYERIDLSIGPLPLFQALQAPIKDLGNLALPNNFPNLWWLHLRYEPTLPLLSLLETLQRLPCLRVLFLSPLGNRWKRLNVPAGFTITFDHLEALMTGSPILQLITAPKLTYLQCTRYPENFFMINENYNHFCGFDFSKITYIQIGIHDYQLEVYIMGMFKVDTSDDDVIPLMIKNHYKWAFDELINSYPNEFHVQTDLTATPCLLSLFTTIVKKSNNLKEIIFDYLTPSEWTSLNDEGKNFFQDALRSAKQVRNITVSGEDFVEFCGYLQDETLCPNLERLACSTQHKQDFNLAPLLKLMSERNKTCSRPLEVELTGFSTVPPEALELAERLGLRLIQKPGDVL